MTITLTGMQVALIACGLVGLAGVALIVTDRGEDFMGWPVASEQTHVGCAGIVLALIVAGALWLGGVLA